MNLVKHVDIINAEGMILGLFEDSERNIYLGHLLTEGKGKIYYKTTFELLNSFAINEFPLKELLVRSDDLLVRWENRHDRKTYLKEEFLELLEGGDKHFGDFHESIINKRFMNIIKGS